MLRDFLPHSNDGLLAWSHVFRTELERVYEAVGVPASVVSEYAAAQGAYAQALARTKGVETRGPLSTSRKDDAKRALVVWSRRLARSVDGYWATTDDQRRLLGLRVRGDRVGSVGVPQEAPALSVREVLGQRVVVRVRAEGAESLQKPTGVRGAWLYSFVGEVAPVDIKGWTFEGGSTRSEAGVTFGPEVKPGAVVWVAARWVSPTDEPGPVCSPVRARLNYMGLNEAA